MSGEALLAVEPKLFFANERTFLHWMHACVSLAAVSMVVTSSSDRSSPTWMACGTALSIIAIFMMIYAYRVFLWRSSMIRLRNGSQADDPIGPAVLAGGVLLALGASVWAVVR
mmetsp:Transcript_70009/g.155997  ORF Transcript_70009/g.155997 Transcript_70009/m.155997 type:complete len:113 (+) Transcript_70009:100-438(+)